MLYGVGNVAHSLTWDLHFQQGEDLHQEDRDPAEGIGEHDEEEALSYGDVAVQPAAQVGHVETRLVDGVEHARVGDDYNQEGGKIKT